jgi:hypothetical protein
MLADKGYASHAIRHDVRDTGATPEIPTKSNRKVQYSVNKPLYALWSGIGCFIGQPFSGRSDKWGESCTRPKVLLATPSTRPSGRRWHVVRLWLSNRCANRLFFVVYQRQRQPNNDRLQPLQPDHRGGNANYVINSAVLHLPQSVLR